MMWDFFEKLTVNIHIYSENNETGKDTRIQYSKFLVD
jgi:hypothetical protein